MKNITKQEIILEIGTMYTKIGFSGTLTPKKIIKTFPSVFSSMKYFFYPIELEKNK